MKPVYIYNFINISNEVLMLTFSVNTAIECGNSPVAMIRKDRKGRESSALYNISSIEDSPSSMPDFSTRTRYIV